jgi:hypothetical protein
VTPEELESQVVGWLIYADEFKAKGEAAREHMNVSSALDLLLRIAVGHRSTEAEGIDFLRTRRCVELLERYHEVNSRLLVGVLDGAPKAAVANDVTVVHLAWLLDQHALGDAMLAIVCDPRVSNYWPHTKFWAEYDRAMAALVARERYEPRPLKPKGYEKRWVPYLDLVAALTAGRDPAPELAAGAVSFEERNRDKRLLDWKMQDGDGRSPVKWDFRAPSILKRWRAGQGAVDG